MIKSEPGDHARIAELLKDTEKVQEALERAGREAIAEHARAGQKIVVWRDGKVVWEDAGEGK